MSLERLLKEAAQNPCEKVLRELHTTLSRMGYGDAPEQRVCQVRWYDEYYMQWEAFFYGTTSDWDKGSLQSLLKANELWIEKRKDLQYAERSVVVRDWLSFEVAKCLQRGRPVSKEEAEKWRSFMERHGRQVLEDFKRAEVSHACNLNRGAMTWEWKIELKIRDGFHVELKSRECFDSARDALEQGRLFLDTAQRVWVDAMGHLGIQS